MNLSTAREKWLDRQLNRIDAPVHVVDIAAIEQNQAVRRAASEKANPPKAANPWEEYRALRGQLRQLEQNVDSTTIYASNIAGNVALIEENIKEGELQKEHAFKSGNARAEQTHEYHLERLRNDLASAKAELKRAQKNEKYAAAALAAFDKRERIAELQTHFDSLNPQAY